MTRKPEVSRSTSRVVETSTDQPRTLTRRRLLTASLGAMAGTLVLSGARLGSPSAAAQIAQTTPGSGSRYFAETGHNLRNPFLARWQAAGAERGLGLPLSEERYVSGSGGVLQTFAAGTLLYDPTREAPWDVQMQPLSPAIRDDQAPRSARTLVAGCSASSGAGCRFFAETGHTLSGAIGAFWAEHGDVPMFGMPVSEPFRDNENEVTAQVFERAVLEDHGSGGVRLRELGLIQAEAEGVLGDRAFMPAPPNGGRTSLISAADGLRLRVAPSLDADVIAVLPDSAEFIAAPGETGEWVAGYVDGYSGWVAAEFLREPPPLPTLSRDEWDPSIWQGAPLGVTNVRAQPTTESRIVEELQYGEPLTVEAWVRGEEVFEGANLWARLETGRYVYARNVGRAAPVLPPPVPADAPVNGRWIDVHLIQQLMVAYEGREPVRTAVTTTGMAGWETPPGFYQILWRTPNETMTSGAIGAEHYYKLEDVLFTQYFTDRGHAIHFAWWRTRETIGRPGSHGCLNLLLDDARFFWDWAGIGTPIYVHH